MLAIALFEKQDKLLLEKQQRVVNSLLLGRAKDYAEYKHLVGQYAAFNEARQTIRDAFMAEEQNDAD